MVAFQAQALVHALFLASIAAGGTGEGAPGFRAAYKAGFFAGYLRDPKGNKIALHSNNPAKPRRPD